MKEKWIFLSIFNHTAFTIRFSVSLWARGLRSEVKRGYHCYSDCLYYVFILVLFFLPNILVWHLFEVRVCVLKTLWPMPFISVETTVSSVGWLSRPTLSVGAAGGHWRYVRVSDSSILVVLASATELSPG